MKKSLILLAGILFNSCLANAQDCTKTLDISSENIQKIFQQLEDHSIRGVQQGGGWSSTICLEGQVQPAEVYQMKQSYGYGGANFTFLKESSEKNATEMYDKFKSTFQSLVPKEWYSEEIAPYSDKSFVFKNNNEGWTREIVLNCKILAGQYYVSIAFNFKPIN